MNPSAATATKKHSRKTKRQKNSKGYLNSFLFIVWEVQLDLAAEDLVAVLADDS